MIIPTLIFIVIVTLIIFIVKKDRIDRFKYAFMLSIFLIFIPIQHDFKRTAKNLHSKSGKLWDKQARKILPRFGRHSVENFSRAVRYFTLGIVPKKFLNKGSKGFSFPTLNAPKKISNPDVNIVFVIGETLRAKSFALTSKDINTTTPLLAKEKGLFYKSIYANGTMTKTSVSATINRVRYPGSTAQMMKQDNNLFKLAKDNNFTTYFISAQSDTSLNILQNFIGKKYIDRYLTRSMLKKKNKQLSPYDDILLEQIKKIDLSHGKKFIVLHQRGSHSPYRKDYPKSFSKLKHPYYNAILYTDYVLDGIIKHIKTHSKKPTYFIFSSDHGELLHEHGRNGHGWFFEEVWRVPFVFYAHNSDLNLTSDLKNIQCHYDVSNLVAKLLGYNTKIEYLKDIYVNGSDIDALAGYLHIKLDNNGKELSVKKILP